MSRQEMLGRLAGGLLLAIPTLAIGQSVKPLFLTGDAAPGTGTTFATGYNASINEAGNVMCVGGLNSSSDTDHAVFTGTSLATMQLVYREGSPAPGTPFNFRHDAEFSECYQSPRGNYASMSARLADPVGDPYDISVWSGQNLGPPLAARVGTAAPGWPGQTISTMSMPLVDGAGYTTFYAGTGGGSMLAGGWAGNYQLLAKEGDAVPSLPGVTLRGFSFPTMNNTGTWLQPVSYNGTSDRGIIAGDKAGNWSVVAMEGDAITNSSQTIGSFNDIGNNFLINDNGTMAFGHYGSSFKGGIVVGTRGNFQIVNERDQVAPGTGGDTFGLSLTSIPKLNNNDEVGFVGDISGAPSSRDKAIWIGPVDGLKIFMREGDALPGYTDVFLEAPASANNGRDLLLNDNGIGVIDIGLDGNVNGNTNEAIIYGTPGDLRTLLREGDSFEVTPGDIRTIAYYEFTDEIGVSGRPIALNNSNELVLTLGFTDGTSGVFVANVPEPAAIMLLAVGALLLRRR
jgi:hypothetical protein